MLFRSPALAGLFDFWDWGHILCCGEGYLRFRPYGGSLFPNAEKVTKKALPRRTARSLGLGVPSLRDRSGRSGYGLLRCTSFRCVRLRRTVAALPPPDRSLHSACRRGKRSKARAKAKAKAKARSKDRSLRRLLQLDRVNSIGIGCLADRHREQARSHKSKSKAAQLPAAKPPHSTMSASSSAFDLDPPATSEG